MRRTSQTSNRRQITLALMKSLAVKRCKKIVKRWNRTASTENSSLRASSRSFHFFSTFSIEAYSWLSTRRNNVTSQRGGALSNHNRATGIISGRLELAVGSVIESFVTFIERKIERFGDLESRRCNGSPRAFLFIYLLYKEDWEDYARILKEFNNKCL